MAEFELKCLASLFLTPSNLRTLLPPLRSWLNNALYCLIYTQIFKNIRPIHKKQRLNGSRSGIEHISAKIK